MRNNDYCSLWYCCLALYIVEKNKQGLGLHGLWQISRRHWCHFAPAVRSGRADSSRAGPLPSHPTSVLNVMHNYIKSKSYRTLHLNHYSLHWDVVSLRNEFLPELYAVDKKSFLIHQSSLDLYTWPRGRSPVFNTLNSFFISFECNSFMVNLQFLPLPDLPGK